MVFWDGMSHDVIHNPMRTAFLGALLVIAGVLSAVAQTDQATRRAEQLARQAEALAQLADLVARQYQLSAREHLTPPTPPDLSVIPPAPNPRISPFKPDTVQHRIKRLLEHLAACLSRLQANSAATELDSLRILLNNPSIRATISEAIALSLDYSVKVLEELNAMTRKLDTMFEQLKTRLEQLHKQLQDTRKHSDN